MADNGRSQVMRCPACNAAPGEPCTQPTDTSRKPVGWFHLAREDAALVAEQPEAAAEELRAMGYTVVSPQNGDA